MKLTFFLICAVFIMLGIVCFKLYGPSPDVCQGQSVTVSKAWWPVWDTFQIGTTQQEQEVKSVRTQSCSARDLLPLHLT